MNEIKLNSMHDIDDKFTINFTKIGHDVVSANIYTKRTEKEHISDLVARVIAYLEPSDSDTCEPMFNEHWYIALDFYEKKYCIEDNVVSFLNYLKNNKIISTPLFSAVCVIPREADITVTEGQVYVE